MQGSPGPLPSTLVHCFYGIASPLSNFHPARFVIDGREYSCVEQYMQAEKARLFRDLEAEESIMKAGTPLAMKRFGRSVGGSAALRAGQGGRACCAGDPAPAGIACCAGDPAPFDKDLWGREAERVVERGLLAKFSQNPELRAALLLTGTSTIVECAPRDRLWGAGLGRAKVEMLAETTPAGSPLALRGQNKLGRLLMRVRAECRAAVGPEGGGGA